MSLVSFIQGGFKNRRSTLFYLILYHSMPLYLILPEFASSYLIYHSNSYYTLSTCLFVHTSIIHLLRYFYDMDMFILSIYVPTLTYMLNSALVFFAVLMETASEMSNSLWVLGHQHAMETPWNPCLCP